jgi:uncharacterized protein Yka (UPF0111/DUF47 family)
MIKYFRRQIEIHKRLIDELRTNIKELGNIIETFKKDTIEKDKEHMKQIDELRTNIKELGDIIETFKKDTFEKDKEHMKQIDDVTEWMWAFMKD